jgi:amidase
MTELHYLSATALAARLRARELTAAAVLAHFEQRVAAINPPINAVVATQWDVARQRALAADAAAARGEFWGPLHGVPMTVKEGFNVEGMVTCVGDRALAGNIAKSNAVAVQRLLDAGAVIFGKTNVPLYMADLQSFNAVYGRTNNPWDVNRTSGGSSGGAAAALAAGLTPLELGSDLAGSIRTPAHFCGVYGHRPTFDLVPVRGHFIGSRTHTGVEFTAAGPMARTVEDLELGLSILAGPLSAANQRWDVTLPRPRPQRLQDYRVGVWLDDESAPLDASVKAVLASTVAQIKAAGCSVVEGAPLNLKLDDFYPLYFNLMAASIGGGIPEKIFKQASTGARFATLFGTARLQTLLGYAKGMTVSHREWCQMEERRARLKARVAEYFRGVDVLLMPVTQTAAPLHADRKIEFYKRSIPVNGQATSYADQMKWIALSALLGLPATSAPVGRTLDGLPVGVQIVGAELQDLTTLDFARHMAALGDGFVPPPL